MYLELKKSCETHNNWVTYVKKILYELGIGNIWENQDWLDLNPKYFLFIIKQRIFDQAKQNLLGIMYASPKGSLLFQYLSVSVELKKYLTQPIPFIYKKYIIRIRLSAYNLNIESDRYRNINRADRLCICCNQGEIEDDFHFVLYRPLFNDIRKSLIKPYYC